MFPCNGKSYLPNGVSWFVMLLHVGFKFPRITQGFYMLKHFRQILIRNQTPTRITAPPIWIERAFSIKKRPTLQYCFQRHFVVSVGETAPLQ